MSPFDLSRMIDERRDLVDLLYEIALRQQDAIRVGHMSSLMQLLSQKQEPLERLHELTQQTRSLLQEFAAAPNWANDAQHDQCRRRHRESEAKLADVLRLEAECEAMLQQQRSEIGEQLLGLGNSARAVNSYAKSGAAAITGSSLDLSSDG